MKKLALFFVFLIGSISYSGADDVTPERFLKDIQQRSAREVVNEYTKNGKLDLIFDFISSGDADWIRIVSQIHNGGDETTPINIYISLAYALPIKPEAVLTAIKMYQKTETGFEVNIKNICNIPFPEVDEVWVNVYILQAIRAVNEVKLSNKDLHDLSSECLTLLYQSKDFFDKRKDH